MEFLRLTDYRTGEPRLVNKADIVLAAPHHTGSRLMLRPDTLLECKEPFEDVAKLLAPEKPAAAVSAKGELEQKPAEKTTK